MCGSFLAQKFFRLDVHALDHRLSVRQVVYQAHPFPHGDMRGIEVTHFPALVVEGARRLGRMVANLNVILGVEALCAAQGIEFRAPLLTSAPLQGAVARLRRDVPALGDDRYMADDLTAAAQLIGSGALVTATATPMPQLAV